MNKYTSLLSFIFGIILTVFVFLSWRSCNKKDDAALVNQDYYLITNQIQKMNKMVVLEQDFSSEVRYTVNGSDVVSRTYTVNVYNKEGQRISASGGTSVSYSYGGDVAGEVSPVTLI